VAIVAGEVSLDVMGGGAAQTSHFNGATRCGALIAVVAVRFAYPGYAGARAR